MGLRRNLKKLIRFIPSDRNLPLPTIPELTPGQDLAVVIHTCDKYKFCWAGWDYYFHKYWDFNSGCKVYFMNEEEPVNYKSVIQLATGTGAWADRLIRGLTMLKEDHVLYLQEDFWPIAPIDIKKFYAITKALKADALRIAPYGPHYTTFRPFRAGDTEVRRFSGISEYLVTHQASIWRRDFLLSCLESGESPWENEKAGSKRLRRKKHNIFICPTEWYTATCRQGKLTPEGIQLEINAGLREG